MKNKRYLLAALVGICCCATLVACVINPNPDDPDDPSVIESLYSVMIEEHIDQMLALQQAAQVEETTSQSVAFNFYYDDTQSMYGFVSPVIMNQTKSGFVYTMDAVIDSAKAMLGVKTIGFSEVNAFTLIGDETNILRWTEIDMFDDLQAGYYKESFYTGSGSIARSGTLLEDGVSVGPMSRLLENGSPFEEDAVTVIVSDLMEQNFDITALSDAIVDYFTNSDITVAASVIACTSEYEGDLSVPAYSTDSSVTLVDVLDYNGDATYYIIIVGPAAVVDEYTATFAQNAPVSLEYVQASFYNQSEEIVVPLEFSLISDTSFTTSELSGYSVEDILSTANTQDLTERLNAFYTACNSSQTDALGRYVNLAAIADVEDGTEYSVAAVEIYQYLEDGTWELCDKNTQTLVSDVTLVDADASKAAITELVNESIVVVAQGRDTKYLSVGLETGSSGALTQNQIYCVTVTIELESSGETGVADQQSDILAYSVNTDVYDLALSNLTQVGDNYSWAKSTEEEQAIAAEVLQKTPKLDVFINSLANADYHNAITAPVYQYVDFVFAVGTASR